MIPLTQTINIAERQKVSLSISATFLKPQNQTAEYQIKAKLELFDSQSNKFEYSQETECSSSLSPSFDSQFEVEYSLDCIDKYRISLNEIISGSLIGLIDIDIIDIMSSPKCEITAPLKYSTSNDSTITIKALHC